MSIAYHAPTQLDIEAHHLRVALEELMHDPSKARQWLNLIAENFPEVELAMSGVAREISRQREEIIRLAAIELLEVSHLPTHEENIAQIIANQHYRSQLVFEAHHHGNAWHSKAEKADKILTEQLLLR